MRQVHHVGLGCGSFAGTDTVTFEAEDWKL